MEYDRENIVITGIFLEKDQFVYTTHNKNEIEFHIGHLSDPMWKELPYRQGCRPKEQIIYAQKEDCENASTTIACDNMPFLDEHFDYHFLNKQKIPLVITPKNKEVSLLDFQNWMEEHRKEVIDLITLYGGILLREFPVENAQNFASVVKSIIGRPLLDYLGGEGSRKKIIQGVYTSTEAPPQFVIPLHNELSCTDHPPEYLCFYCEIPPILGSGQTIVGSKEVFFAKLIKPINHGKRSLKQKIEMLLKRFVKKKDLNIHGMEIGLKLFG